MSSTACYTGAMLESCNRQLVSFTRVKRPILSLSAFFLLLTPAFSQVVLEDFSQGLRKNGVGTNLFEAYISDLGGGSCGGTTFSVVNGVYRQSTPSGSGCKVYAHFVPLASNVDRYRWPDGFTQYYKMSGNWNQNLNRFRFKFRCNKGVNRRSDEWSLIQWGTYSKSHNWDAQSQGRHFYHYFNPQVYADRWIQFEGTWKPQHEVGLGDPGFNPTARDGVQYFDGLTRWYIDFVGSNNGAQWPAQPYYCEMDDFRFDYDPNTSASLESKVSNLTYQYSGSRYEVTWNGIGNQSISYEVRYSTSDLRSIGFTNGTSGGTVRTRGDAYPGVFWASPNLPESQVLYVGIRPQGESGFYQVAIRPNGVAATPPPPSISPCDVNRDGATNATDVQLATDQALGKASCTADLDASGKCDAVDVQRVTNAVTSGSCRVGP